MVCAPVSESEDEIRENILRYLYEIHRNARSPRSAGKGIRDLQKELKRRFGYKQQDVARNLDYLTQQQWAREDVTSRMYRTPSGTLQPAEKVTYKITHVGIDLLQRPSAFRRSNPDKMNINVTNVGGVSVVGNGNVVNTEFRSLSRELEVLKTEFGRSDLNDDEKLAVISDIDSLLAQLQKPVPNGSVVGSLWKSVQNAAAVASISSALAHAGEMIAPLLG